MAVNLSLSDAHATHLYNIICTHLKQVEKMAKDKNDPNGDSIFVYGIMTGKAQILLTLLEDAGTDIEQSYFAEEE